MSSEKRDERVYVVASVILFVVSALMLFGGIYMQDVMHVYKAPLVLGVVAGILLATPLEIWNFSDPDTLFRVMAFQDRFLMVCFGFAIGLGAILLYAVNLIVPHPNFGIKDFFVPGVVIGGRIFGAGVGDSWLFPWHRLDSAWAGPQRRRIRSIGWVARRLHVVGHIRRREALLLGYAELRADHLG